MMLAKTHAARKAASVPGRQAPATSIELQSVEEAHHPLRHHCSQIHADLAYIRRRSNVLIWLAGVNAAATFVIVGMIFRLCRQPLLCHCA